MGTLYLIGTPIGNLKDMTLRAIHVLKTADHLFCERPSWSQKLLQHYQIQKKPSLFQQGNEKEGEERILALLGLEKSVALFSDAGMPVISDPGEGLVGKVLESNHRIEVIPGASSISAAACALGLSSFIFLGFLTHKKSLRKKKLSLFAELKTPLLLFEAPHRLNSLLLDIQELWGDKTWIGLAHEMSKVHESYKKAPIEEFLNIKPKGEYVVAVWPPQENARIEEHDNLFLSLAKALPPGEASALGAQYTKIDKKSVYQRIAWLKEQKINPSKKIS